jgi:hypothetical protein
MGDTLLLVACNETLVASRMKSRAREIRWAIAGFASGFVLCYLLTAAFRPERAASPGLAKAGAAPVWRSGPATPGFQITNSQLPVLHIQLPPQSEGPTMELMPDVPRPVYSFDLIDTHFKLPEPPNKP